ncbi:MAG: transcriptional regulator [Mesorhizobium sp.]|nr:MAG: transcriptional regulator [Mesorhizobium sp.]
MDEAIAQTNTDLLGLTADIVAAYVQSNAMPVADLPSLIASVNSSLSGLVQPVVAPPPTLTPAVNPKKSVFPDFIVSLEDGRKFKSMKRHLGLLGMTPDQHRAKWGCPALAQQTFEGYDCTADCSGHEAGYDWAERNGITDVPMTAMATVNPSTKAVRRLWKSSSLCLTMKTLRTRATRTVQNKPA